MIKAVISRTGKHPLVVLGLSRKNTEGLLDGKPIIVNGEMLGLNGDVVLLAGEDEMDVRAMIQELTGGQRLPTQTYTCCTEHAAALGVPHRPPPPGYAMNCPQ